MPVNKAQTVYCKSICESARHEATIVFFFNQGLKAPSIVKALEEESISVSRVSVYKLLLKYQQTGTVARHAYIHYKCRLKA